MRRTNLSETRTEDISGILILRHVLMEVIASCRARGLEELADKFEEALRGVQPSPSQPMRRRKAGNDAESLSKQGVGAPRRRTRDSRLRA